MKKGKEEFYRKKWFTILCLILFPPAGIILLWIYRKDMDKRLKIVLSTASAIWFIIALISDRGGFAPPAGSDLTASQTRDCVQFETIAKDDPMFFPVFGETSAAKAKSTSAEAEPTSAETKPAATQTEPAPAKSKPETSAAKAKSTSAEAEPTSAETKPAATRTEPAPAKSKPKTSAAKAKSTSAEAEPTSAKSKPKTSAAKAKSTSAEAEPTSAKSKPKTSAAASKSDEKSFAYVLNTNAKKFHYPDCASAKRIKPENRETFKGDREELINSGYSPCKRCNP